MGNALEGDSTNAATAGVKGTNNASGNGVYGTSAGGDAIAGLASAQGKSGVLGLSPKGIGVTGISDPVNGDGTGVYGQGKLFGGNFTSPQTGELANSTTGNAVNGTSAQSDPVVGTAQAQGKAGILGLAPDGNAVVGISDNATGIYGKGGQFAAVFDGKVQVNGDHTVSGTINAGKDIVLTGADCAEEFDVESSAAIDAGTVMVIVEHGALQPSANAYDRKVAGVISGAGEY